MKRVGQRPERETTQRRLVLPRWILLLLSVTVWPVLVLLAHGILPWAASRKATRVGWSAHHLAWWNWTGLILVGLGTTTVLWFWCVHVRQIVIRKQMELKFTPEYLLTNGPYRFSRNPAYVAVLVIWIGWSIFYGSWTVLAGTILLWLLMSLVVIPREERGLAAKFGQDYLQYRAAVPRWLGKIRR